MMKTADVVPEEQHFILSSLPPNPAQKRLALAFLLGILIVVFIVAGPLSSMQTRPVAAFLPAYLAAMFVTDSITAILLFTQFAILRSRAILVIASGYVFTALVLIPYILTFPGVFAPTSLLGGLQSTAWLFILWHAGFPIFVIGYALLKDAGPSKRLWRGTVRAAITLSVALTAAVISAAVLLCIVGEETSPIIILDTLRFGSLFPYYVGGPVMVTSISALIALWLRRRSLLDLWLMVVMCLFAIEIPLSYWPNPTRFSIGWYTVRVMGFLSSSLILIVLLYEITTLYTRLLRAILAQRREREARLITGDSVAAAIAHEVRQPLTAMITSADAGLRFLDRSMPDLNRVKQALERIVADGHRAGEVVASIRASFKSSVRNRTLLDVNELIREALALVRGDLQKHQILVQAEPNKQLPEVRGDLVQLRQVLLNLITNAIEAMAAKDEPRVLCVKSEAHEGDGVTVSVADTGIGIAAQDIDQIFNPLFTTKSDGMGMGLSICRSIIEAHQGRLWATRNESRGMTFSFALPTLSN